MWDVWYGMWFVTYGWHNFIWWEMEDMEDGVRKEVYELRSLHIKWRAAKRIHLQDERVQHHKHENKGIIWMRIVSIACETWQPLLSSANPTLDELVLLTSLGTSSKARTQYHLLPSVAACPLPWQPAGTVLARDRTFDGRHRRPALLNEDTVVSEDSCFYLCSLCLLIGGFWESDVLSCRPEQRPGFVASNASKDYVISPVVPRPTPASKINRSLQSRDGMVQRSCSLSPSWSHVIWKTGRQLSR